MPFSFQPALDQMVAAATNIFDPLVFQEYVRAHNFTANRTATYISVDSVGDLRPELRTEHAPTMVFRLGGGNLTKFALARCVNGWGDYFFVDADVFGEVFENNRCVANQPITVYNGSMMSCLHSSIVTCGRM